MKANSERLVSVVIPAYNGQRIIERAIDSVLQQTYKIREIIVVDDGSTDMTRDVLRRYRSEITVIEQQNLGTMAARNTGARQSSGSYITFLDQDDWWVPQKLEIQIRALEADSSVGLVFGNLEAVNERGRSLGFMTNPREYCCSPSLDDLLLIFPLYPSSATLRKDLFDKAGGFDTRFGTSGAYGDQDFHIRLRQLTRFKFLNVRVGYYFWDEFRSRRLQGFLENFPIFIDKYWNNGPLLDPRKRSLRQSFARKCGDHLTYMLRRLLEQNGNVANDQLLLLANGYHDQLKGIFGSSYLIAAGLDSLNLASMRLRQDELEPALSTLLFLYLGRTELQGKFPEVFQGDLTELFQWAYRVAAGIYSDIDNTTLYPFKARFEAWAREGTIATKKVRSELASRLVGRGIAIGDRSSVLPLPKAEEVVYVSTPADWTRAKNGEDLKRAQVHGASPDNCRLRMEDSSVDFIVVSNALGSLSDPLASFHEWYRCLRPSGYLLLQVPDRRYTMDKNKPSTTIKHIFQDQLNDISSPIVRRNREPHEHIWTDVDFEGLINYVTKFQTPFTMVDSVQTNPQSRGFLWLLQKPREGIAKRSDAMHIQEASFIDLLDLVTEYRNSIREKDALIRSLQSKLRSALFELGGIHRSVGYKMLRAIFSRIDRAFPEGTRRGRVRSMATTGLRIITEEGIESFVTEAARAVRRSVSGDNW